MENKLKTKIWAVALFFAVTGVVSLLVVLNKNTDVFKGLFSAQQFALQKTVVQAPKETLPILAERIGGSTGTTVATGDCNTKITNAVLNVQYTRRSGDGVYTDDRIPQMKPGDIQPFAAFKFSEPTGAAGVKICSIKFKMITNANIVIGDQSRNDFQFIVKTMKNSEINTSNVSQGTLVPTGFDNTNVSFDFVKKLDIQNTYDVTLNFTQSLPITGPNDPTLLFLLAKASSSVDSESLSVLSTENNFWNITTNAPKGILSEDNRPAFKIVLGNTIDIKSSDTDIQLQNDPAQTQASAHFDITPTGGVGLMGMQLTAKRDGVDAPVNPFIFASEIGIYSEGQAQPLVSKNIRDVAPETARTVPEVIPNTFPPQTRQRQLNKGEIDATVSRLGSNIDFPFAPQLFLESAKKITVKIKLRDRLSSDTKFQFGIENVTINPSDATKSGLPAWGGKITLSGEPLRIIAENQSSNTEIQIPRNKSEFTEIGKFSFKTNYGTTNLLDLNFEVWDSLATGIHKSNQVIKAVKILDGNNVVLTIPTANISTFFSTLINFGTGIQISTTPKILSFQIQPVETLTTGDKYIIKLRNNGSSEASSIGGNNVTQPPESALDLADFKTNPFSVVDAGTQSQTKKLSVSLKPTNVGSVEIARNAKGVSLGKIIFKTTAKNAIIKSINFHSFGVADMPFTNIKISPSLQTAGEISSSSGSKPVTDLTDLSARNRNMTGLEVTNLSNVTVPNDNKEHTFYITGDLISGAAVDNRIFGISLQNINDIEATNTVVSGTGSSEMPIAPGEIELAAVNNGNEFTVKSGATSSTGTLTLTNIVNNISGHTAVAADFPLSIENQTVAVTSGVPITTLPAGSYKAISQNLKSTEYTTSGWTGTGCAANGTFTLAAGATVSCSITYTVITPTSTTGTLTLTNIINGGIATQADLTLSIENQTVAVTNGTPITLPTGIYKAKSINSKSTEYTSSGWTGAGCGADGTVTIAAATPVSCTITYTANARTDATLKLINYVVGGSAVEADFSVFIDGVQFERNTIVPVLPGAHRVTTSANVQNYTQSEWRGDCATNGDVDAIVGSDKMCHVTWNFVPPAGAPSCEQQGKVTYTGPTVGTVTNGMCISCSIADFTRFGNTCTPPTPQATQTCEQQGKYTYTGPDKPGVRTTGMCIDCSMEVYQSLGGTCTATAMPTPTDSYQPPLAVTPNLRGSARLVRAPEQGNTGPEVAIYFGALAAAQAVLWLRKKKKK